MITTMMTDTSGDTAVVEFTEVVDPVIRDGVLVVGCGVGFQRIRRITGYLVGSIDRFCDSKRAEVKDRVKHM